MIKDEKLARHYVSILNINNNYIYNITKNECVEKNYEHVLTGLNTLNNLLIKQLEFIFKDDE